MSRPLPAQQFEQLCHDGWRRQIKPGSSAMVSHTVLIVHTDADALAALDCLLRADTGQVLTAASAEHAFALLALHPVQVSICEQRLPDMSGTEFFDKVKSIYPDNFRIMGGPRRT